MLTNYNLAYNKSESHEVERGGERGKGGGGGGGGGGGEGGRGVRERERERESCWQREKVDFCQSEESEKYNGNNYCASRCIHQIE